MIRMFFCWISIVFLCCISSQSLAWQHSIELGYGYSHDPNHTRYNNSGFFLSADLLPIWCNCWTHWSLIGALGKWHSTAPRHQNLMTAALSLGLRFYPLTIQQLYPPYFFVSFGPALLSNSQFGANTQGSNLTIQSNGGLGIEFNCIDINLRLVHFSNAGLARRNEGFNFLYVLSIGYLF